MSVDTAIREECDLSEIAPSSPHDPVVDKVEHAPGVYFGLADDVYHADAALGSTDIKTLAFSPADYWFRSPLNPDREENDSTPAQIFGSAVHKLVLEGRQAFEGRYAPTMHNGSTKAGKAEREAISEAGKTAIKKEEFDRILAAGAMISRNQVLTDAFTGGMPEVSIFWEDGGIRKKCRIDYLKARACVDLKSIRNSRNVGFPDACRRAIAEYRYDVQAEHYRRGRAELPRLVAEGAVFGDFDQGWLDRVAAVRSPAFVFAFYQAEGAPLTWGAILSPENPILTFASNTIATAEENYRLYRDRYGLKTPWTLDEPLVELELAAMPGWYGRT